MISLFTTFCLYAMPAQMTACQKSLEATAIINDLPRMEQRLKKSLTINFSPTLQYVAGTAYTLSADKKLGFTIPGNFVNIDLEARYIGGGITLRRSF